MSTSALSFNREASSLSASFVQLIKASNRERRKPRKIPLLYCLKLAASGKLTAAHSAPALTDWSTIENFHLNFPVYSAAAIHTRVAAGLEDGG